MLNFFFSRLKINSFNSILDFIQLSYVPLEIKKIKVIEASLWNHQWFLALKHKCHKFFLEFLFKKCKM